MFSAFYFAPPPPTTVAANEFQPFNFFSRFRSTQRNTHVIPPYPIAHKYASLLLGKHAVSRRVYFLSNPENNKRPFRRPHRLPYDCRDYRTGHRDGENCRHIASECIINRYISICRRGGQRSLSPNVGQRWRRTPCQTDKTSARRSRPLRMRKRPPHSRCDRRRLFSVRRPSAGDFTPSANRSFGPIKNRNVRWSGPGSKTNKHGMFIV